MPEEFESPYDAAIASLEAERDEIDRVLDVMRRFRARHEYGGGLLSRTALQSASTSLGSSDEIVSDTFFGLTIADAAVKFLSKWAGRKPQPTNAIIDALERGGLKRAAYTTVYGILNRRAKKQRDVVNVKGDWGLAVWYLGASSIPPKPKRKFMSVRPSDFEKENDDPPSESEEPQKVNGQAASDVVLAQ